MRPTARQRVGSSGGIAGLQAVNLGGEADESAAAGEYQLRAIASAASQIRFRQPFLSTPIVVSFYTGESCE
jgi:hypothetical protein